LQVEIVGKRTQKMMKLAKTMMPPHWPAALMIWADRE
jgi:hypothetical protein